MSQSTSLDRPILTTPGRRLLTDRLVASTEQLRRMAEEHGRDGTAPDEEYQQLAAQVAQLRELLEVAVEPARIPDDPLVVELGDEVAVEYVDGGLDRFVLTHPVEAALLEDNASVSSPLGQALVGRRAGDRVTVHAPDGDWQCTIVARERAT